MKETTARRPFGATPAGEAVEAVTLSNGVLSCEIITFGAALRTLRVPDRTGAPVDVVLGYDTIEEYCARNGHLGAVVGRFANRIAGGRFTLDGVTYDLETNNGPNHLHGGAHGYSRRVWEIAALSDTAVTLALDSPDGEANYPGHVRVSVTYVLDGPALSLRYRAETDAATPLNLTNHTYFNLAGHGAGPVLDQTIQLFCAAYTPSDTVSIPRGTVEPVEGTPMDLRQPAAIGARIGEDFDQLRQAGGYDHNWIVDGETGVLRPCARAKSAETGIVLNCETTLPGMQFYTANGLTDRPGKEGASYGPRHGFCLETQFYPDSPNQPAFPSCILRPGAVFDHTTRFVFSAE